MTALRFLARRTGGRKILATTLTTTRRHFVGAVVSPEPRLLLSSRLQITNTSNVHWNVDNKNRHSSRPLCCCLSSSALASLSSSSSTTTSPYNGAASVSQLFNVYHSTSTLRFQSTTTTIDLSQQLKECLQEEQQYQNDKTKAFLATGENDDDGDGDPLERAQSILKKLIMQESSSSNEYNNTEEEALLLNQYRASVLDAWLTRQDALVKKVMTTTLGHEKEEGIHGGEEDESDRISQSKAQHHQNLLRQAVHATKAAHELLEAMEPQLAPHHVVLLDADGGGDSHMTTTCLEDESDYFLESSSSSNDSSSSSSSSSSDGTTSSSLQEQIVNSDNNIDIAMYGQAVLKAWARVLEAAAHDDGLVQKESHHHHHRPRSMRGIPQRAQFLLERMLTIGLFDKNAQSARNSSSDEIIVSATECYNAVLQAWAYSHEHLRGVMAERVFQEMHSSSLVHVQPNGNSYRFIIRAWSWSRDRRAAFTATGHLMKMLRKLERSCTTTSFATNDHDDMDDDLEPTLEDYHVLLQAWTRAEDKMSPQKAQSVMRLMEHALDKGYTVVRPDMDCYLYVLQTCAQRPFLVDLGRSIVNEVFQQLQNDLMIPNAACYDAAICVWKNCALHPDADEGRQECVEKTLDLLQEMRLSSQKASTSSAEEKEMGNRGSGITTENINHVLEALTVSSDPRRTEQAESLLKEMEDNLTTTTPQVSGAPTPNADSYRLVLQVWNNTTDPNRLERAKEILSRMKDHLLVDDGQEEENNTKNRGKKRRNTPMAATPVDVLNAFIHHCASFSIENSQEQGMLLVREALAAVTTFQSTSVHPNAASYTSILQAARNLLPPGPGRQRVVEQVFQLACDNGMVNELVLRELLAVATSEQYTRLVLAHSQVMEGTTETRIVPEEWTSNAFGDSKNNKGRVLSADGRRSRPLAVDGQVKMTKAMQDFKMRRLRDKRNRNLLRGGRWDRSQDDDEIISTKNTNASTATSRS